MTITLHIQSGSRSLFFTTVTKMDEFLKANKVTRTAVINLLAEDLTSIGTLPVSKYKYFQKNQPK